jgi:SDR family mycofactocin-dependent oxidoreductase
MSRLQGKTAFITGAGRGQGRAHAVRLASDGADVVVSDICTDVDSIPYPMARPEDLDETARLVEKTGQRASAQIADVRDLAQLSTAYAAGLAELGVDHADIVVANAGGIAYPSDDGDEVSAFRDSLDIMLVGVWNTLKVATPSMIAAGTGGSVVLTSSSAALRGFVGGWGGLDGYTAAKAGVVGLMQVYANLLGPHRIRVNSVHPTGVNTGMVQNQAFQNWITAGTAEPISLAHNVLPIEILDADDVAAAVAWLASDDAAFVTGMALRVDAGFANS